MKQIALMQIEPPISSGRPRWIKSIELPSGIVRPTMNVITYNNKINLFSVDTSGMLHYSWDGEDWVIESTPPTDCKNISLFSTVVYNNKIHLLGGNSTTTSNYHYSWNGRYWAAESTLPYNFANSNSAVVYDNKIHILGGYYYDSGASGRTSHYSWDGTNWVEESTLPYRFCRGNVVVYNNKIHIIAGNVSSSTTYQEHYALDNGTWVLEPSLLDEAKLAWTVVYNNKIHIFGGSSSRHQVFDGNSWKYENPIPIARNYDGTATVYDGLIETIGGYDGTAWLKDHYAFGYFAEDNSVPSFTINSDYVRNIILNNTCQCSWIPYDNRIKVNESGLYYEACDEGRYNFMVYTYLDFTVKTNVSASGTIPYAKLSPKKTTIFPIVSSSLTGSCNILLSPTTILTANLSFYGYNNELLFGTDQSLYQGNRYIVYGLWPIRSSSLT